MTNGLVVKCAMDKAKKLADQLLPRYDSGIEKSLRRDKKGVRLGKEGYILTNLVQGMCSLP